MTDSILIVGGGIAGLTAAQRIASSGARAIVVEQEPVLGGRLAAPMTRANAIGSRSEGEPIPLFGALAANENIEIITSARLESIDGRPGSFTATIVEQARFVTDACTRCKLCHSVCPVVLPNEFDAGLTFRKAIYTPMIRTLPEAWAIDIDNCLNTPPNYLPCNRCSEVCEDDAIHFDQPLSKRHTRHVGALILAPGMQVESGDAFADLGYGVHPDVVTSAEMQRLLESPGPSGGFATRPSNEEYPESVLLVLDNPSPFALYIMASQAKQLVEQEIEKVSLLALSQPTSDEAAAELTAKTGIEVHWGAAFRTDASDDDIEVSFEDFGSNKFVSQRYQMIVLCTGVTPPHDLVSLASATGVTIGEDGFLAGGAEGVFVAGCASGPKNIKDSITEANAAADAALQLLNPMLLDGDATKEASAPVQNDEMRAQIEKLLLALVNQK